MTIEATVTMKFLEPQRRSGEEKGQPWVCSEALCPALTLSLWLFFPGSEKGIVGGGGAGEQGEKGEIWFITPEKENQTGKLLENSVTLDRKEARLPAGPGWAGSLSDLAQGGPGVCMSLSSISSPSSSKAGTPGDAGLLAVSPWQLPVSKGGRERPLPTLRFLIAQGQFSWLSDGEFPE